MIYAEEAEQRVEKDAPPVRITSASSRFIENMGLHFEDCGIPRIGGRILGLLMISTRPVSSEEMSGALQVSRSSISTNVRSLQMNGLVDKLSLPGERVDFYVFSKETWQRTLEMRLAGILDLKTRGEQGLQSLETGGPAQIRFEEMLNWVQRVEHMLENLKVEPHTTQEEG